MQSDPIVGRDEDVIPIPFDLPLLDSLRGQGITQEDAQRLMPYQEKRENLTIIQSRSGHLYGEQIGAGGTRYFIPYACSANSTAHANTGTISIAALAPVIAWLPLVILSSPVRGPWGEADATFDTLMRETADAIGIDRLLALTKGASPQTASEKGWLALCDYQKQLFETTWPETLLVSPTCDPTGLNAFREDLLEQHGNSQRLPVIPGGPTP